MLQYQSQNNLTKQKEKLESTDFTCFLAQMSAIRTPLCQVVMWCNVLILVVEIREFCPDSTHCVNFRENVLSFCCQCNSHLILYYAKNLSITYLDTMLISLRRYLTCRILCCNSSTVSKSSPITPIIDSISPSYIPISFNILRDGELI